MTHIAWMYSYVQYILCIRIWPHGKASYCKTDRFLSASRQMISMKLFHLIIAINRLSRFFYLRLICPIFSSSCDSTLYFSTPENVPSIPSTFFTFPLSQSRKATFTLTIWNDFEIFIRFCRDVWISSCQFKWWSSVLKLCFGPEDNGPNLVP